MLSREQALAIYHAGAEVVVRVLLEMDARIHALEQQVQELSARLDVSEKRVRDLENQLAKNSRNGSPADSPDIWGRRPRSSKSPITPRSTGCSNASVATALWRITIPRAWRNDKSTTYLRGGL